MEKFDDIIIGIFIGAIVVYVITRRKQKKDIEDIQVNFHNYLGKAFKEDDDSKIQKTVKQLTNPKNAELW